MNSDDTKNQDAAESSAWEKYWYDYLKSEEAPAPIRRHFYGAFNLGYRAGQASKVDHLDDMKRIQDAERENERLKAEHEKFCIGAQQKTDADFKVTREAAERAREQLSDEREKSKKLYHMLEAIRSQMCWERDIDQLTMGFCDLHTAVTEVLAAHAESEAKSSPAENNEKRGSSDDL